MSFFSNADLIEVEPKPWMKDKKFVLVKDIDHLTKVVDQAIDAGKCAVDLETTGLDSRIKNNKTVDKIVGYCLSYDGDTGFYVPVGHVDDKTGKTRSSNLSRLPVADQVKRLCENCVTIYHNALFDHEFLYGSAAHIQIDDPDMFEDTLILDYLRDSTAFKHGLKHLSEKFLNMEMISLKELFADRSGGLSYAKLDPTNEAVLWYAGSDAVCTFLLYEYLKEHGEDQKQVYRIEKACVPSHRWMERNRPTIDLQYTTRLIKEMEQLEKDSVDDIYQSLYDSLKKYASGPLWDELGSKSGFPVSRVKKEFSPDFVRELYDVYSTKQLGDMLELLKKFNREFSSVELERTEASNQVKTSNDALDELEKNYGERFTFIKNIGRMRKLQKALSTYAKPLHQNVDRQDSTTRLKFTPYKTDSGRFAARGGRPEFGYSGVQIQSMPATYNAAKFPVKKVHQRPSGPGDDNAELFDAFEEARENEFLKLVYDNHFIQDLEDGQEYCIRKTCEGCPFAEECDRTEPYKKKFLSIEAAMRPAFVGRRNSSMVAIDYSGVELRVATNLTNETNWIEEFEEGDGDLHTLTAKIVYGKNTIESMDPGNSERKKMRQNAKAANFAVLYGGGGGAIARQTGVTYDEGNEILNKMLSGLPAFSRWKKDTIKKAHRNEYVETCIGRKVRLGRINDPDWKIKSGQERKAVNSVIQGSAGGDVLKYSMGAVYREMKKRDWLDRVRLMCTIHDELVFDIDNEVLEEAIPVIEDRMVEFSDKIGWRVPLEVDVELDKRWQPKYDWGDIFEIEEDTGLASGPFPKELKPYITLKKGMWYKDNGEVFVWDGNQIVPEDHPSLSLHTKSENTEEQETMDDRSNNEQKEDDILKNLEEAEAKKEAEKPNLPIYEYEIKANLTESNASMYMLRLKRVLSAMKALIRDRRTEPTHCLKIKTMQNDPLFPENKAPRINPTVFEILAYYEGL